MCGGGRSLGRAGGPPGWGPGYPDINYLKKIPRHTDHFEHTCEGLGGLALAARGWGGAPPDLLNVMDLLGMEGVEGGGRSEPECPTCVRSRCRIGRPLLWSQESINGRLPRGHPKALTRVVVGAEGAPVQSQTLQRPQHDHIPHLPPCAGGSALRSGTGPKAWDGVGPAAGGQATESFGA